MSLLDFRGVSLAEGEGVFLRDVDVSVGSGDRLVVFGPAGSGKGTFLRLAAGTLEPSSGSVSLEPPRPGRPAPVGFVRNEGGLLSNLSLLHNVMLPAVYHGLLDPAEAQRRARRLLEELGVSGQAHRRPALASVSARRLTQLARALLVEPAVFVLEDPLSDVDAPAARTIRRVLE